MKLRHSVFLSVLLIVVLLLSIPAAAADFDDVADNAWYAGAVDYCVGNGYFNGTSGRTFSPDAPMTRAMLVTVLHRHAGKPAPTADVSFPDVEPGKWYTQAVAWAAENRIVDGYSDGTFRPDRAVSRQEIMTLLCRYVTYLGCEPDTDDSRILDTFGDCDTVAGWASPAVRWCTSVGIISGIHWKISPEETSTRAQIATILMRLDAYLEGDLTSIIITASDNGTIVPEGEFQVVTGTSILVQVQPNEQCVLDSVTFNDVPQQLKKSYTASSANGPLLVCANFHAYIGNPYSGYGQLVNRSYPIADAEHHTPDDLVIPERTEVINLQLRADAADAADRMIADYLAENPESELRIQSGYRSHSTQILLYNRQITRKDGNIYAAGVVSAVPGTSEHQLGLAIDLTTDGKLEQTFGATPEGIWLEAHCHEYGYILRYPADKERITGIFYEPWHFRYVGTDIAADMNALGIKTLEEYYGLYLAPEDLTPYLPYLNP